MTQARAARIDAASPSDLPDIRALFRAYAAGLGVDLCFQDFEAELSTLPDKYAPPEGALLIARDAAGRALGCVAMRPLSPGTCEMKRLFTLPEARGTGLGARLVEAVMAAARAAGHARMVLDTLPHLTAALAIYDRRGFVRTAPYYHNPLPGVVYLECML